MSCIRAMLAILHLRLLPFFPVARAFDVLHESDSTLAAQLQLTSGTEHGKIQKTFSWEYPTSYHDRVLQPYAFNPLEELRYALDVMQTRWFQVWVGTWPTAIDWTRAVLDTYLVSSLSTLSKVAKSGPQHTIGYVDLREIDNEINKYFTQNVAYYFGEDGFSLRNQAYDDMLWVVLGWLESVKFIHNHGKSGIDVSDRDSRPIWHGHQFITPYAHQAHVFYELAARGWDTHFCNGGMVWSPYLGPYKNAITNQLFISASIGMYLHFPGDNNTSPFMLEDIGALDLVPTDPFDLRFLKAAVDGYAWLKNSNMTNRKGLYVDGYHISDWKKDGTECDLKNTMVYTYNQAVVLSGLRGLWESTRNKTYLEDGHQLARNAIKATGWRFETASAPTDNEWAGLGQNGILEDHCDASGHCDQNAQTFKGIFFHHLTLFCEPLPLKPVVPGKTFYADKMLALLHRQSCREYAVWTAHNAHAALETRDEKARFGMWWGAKEGVDSPSLPEGAVDYRTDESVLREPLWSRDTDMRWSSAVQSYENGNGLFLDATGRIRATAVEAQEHDLIAVETDDKTRTESDPNSRGRGRTVETQGGGVAVLRALVELLQLE